MPWVAVLSSVALLATLPWAACARSGSETGEGRGAEERPGPATRSATADLPPGVEAISFLGDPLRSPNLPDSALAVREAQLADARAELDARPEDVDALIWVGRRQAYLGRYRDAIAAYSRGIELHPDDPRLHRHRGHRFITVRELDRATADLETAARLIEGTEDEVEPDGLPNPRRIPTSTLHFNIWYHLGLARYLEGDLEEALAAYRRCLAVSGNPDALVATSHWLYMTLRRLGREAEAETVLEPVREDMDVIENHAYHELLLLYRGERDAEALWSAATDDPSGSAVAYGVANWHLYNGREALALEGFRRIVEGEEWAGFGHIAAEAELARTVR